MRAPTHPEVDGGRTWLRLQGAIWLGLSVLYLVFDQGRQPDADLVGLIGRTLVWGGVGFVVSSAFGVAYSKWAVQERSLWWAGSVAVAASIIGGVVWLWAFHQIDGWLGIEGGWEPMRQWPREQLYVEWMDYALMMLVWHGVVFSIVQTRRTQEQTQRALASQSAATEAQLNALRAQLHPHFLFNAINSAMALTHENPHRSEEVLQRLADVLRSVLAEKRRWIPLREELQPVADYLDIEKVRFEDLLQVTVEVGDSEGAVWVPAGILLPLVDNAIKHGMRQLHEPMDLRITALRRDGQVVVSVANTGRLSSAAQFGRSAVGVSGKEPRRSNAELDNAALRTEHGRSMGVGLDNVARRLALEFGDRARLSLSQDGDFVVAEIIFPEIERSDA